ncbi:tyrosine-type recombinase/integrase [uncultured Desulfobacter sp.]|uniref:tyrosine-type recombinase/integrase n=1 Tax=uncultured Desulfobacter sp. TaxID=240139 RepID=UPI0029F4AF51|nr:tyrosine-type recombinase/integrase [uncultured Desulfobacter sp.]
MVEDLLFRFREHLKVLNRSPATVKAYACHTKEFLDALDIRDVKKITTPMIETWIRGLWDYRNGLGKPYATGTVCLKIRSVKRFFEFLESANIIFINPAEFIKEPQKKTRIKPVLTSGEVKRILDQPNLGTLTGIRDRTVLEVLYSTGIRLNELCSLTIYDADLTGGMLRITKGKGSKDRVVPLGRHAVKFLREYIAKVRPRFSQKNRTSRYLFMDYLGNPVSKAVVSIMIRKCRKAAKIKSQVTAHTFRHTFATVLVKNGADIRAVQKMLGHSDIKTTQVYIRSLGLDIKKEHSKTHPRKRDKETLRSSRPRIEMVRGHYERRSV